MHAHEEAPEEPSATVIDFGQRKREHDRVLAERSLSPLTAIERARLAAQRARVAQRKRQQTVARQVAGCISRHPSSQL